MKVASGSAAQRAKELFSHPVDKANGGNAAICTYSWAYRRIFNTTYDKWSQAYMTHVITDTRCCVGLPR